MGSFEVHIVGVVLSTGVTGYLLSKARVCHYQVPGGSLRSAVFSREEAHDERPLDTTNMPVYFGYTTSGKIVSFGGKGVSMFTKSLLLSHVLTVRLPVVVFWGQLSLLLKR
jgi:hypothetical protein